MKGSLNKTVPLIWLSPESFSSSVFRYLSAGFRLSASADAKESSNLVVFRTEKA